MEPHFWEQPEKMRTVYQAEIEELVKRELYGKDAILESDCVSLTRGPKLPGATKENVQIYGQGVHADHGATPEQYTERIRAIKVSMGQSDDVILSADRYDEMMARDDIGGFTHLNFWRPIRPMKEPLKHLPMCYCDPNTVSKQDLLFCRYLNVPFNPG
eukprot:2937755-Prymnesium_polylepis.1